MRRADLIEGMVKDGFMLDWQKHRAWAANSVSIATEAMLEGTDIGFVSGNLALRKTVRKLVSASPILNAYTVSRAKESWFGAFVIMLAVSSDEQRSEYTDLFLEQVLKCHDHLTALRIDQTINWIVSPGVAMPYYEIIV